MDLSKAIKDIESTKFSARVMNGKSIVGFIEHIKSQNSVQYLFNKYSRKKFKKMLSRIIFLSNKRIDNKYRNPYDYALATYVWICHIRFPDIALYGCLVSETPKLELTKNMLAYLLKNKDD